MRSIGTKAWRWLRNSKAVSALEYAILIGVIAVAIGLALNTLGGDLTTAIEKVGDSVEAINPGTINPTPSPAPSAN